MVKTSFLRLRLYFFLMIALTFPGIATAACSSPAGIEAAVEYMSSSFYYCNDTNWVDMTKSGGDATTGLFGHWKLDEISGTTAVDSSPSGYNGTMYGGLNAANDSVTGNVSTALDFDGNDFINMGDIAASAPLTISAWVKVSAYPSSNNETIFKTNNPASTYCGVEFRILSTGVPFVRNGDCLGASSGSRYDIQAGTAISINTWNHVVAVVRAAQDVDIYLDGVLQSLSFGGSNNTLSFSADAAEIGITRPFGPYYFTGKIDDVRIYSRALTQIDVGSLYCLTVGGHIDYDTVDHVMTFCSDTGKFEMGPNPGTGGVACSATGSIAAGTEGTWQYDSTNKKIVYCDGTNWRNAGE